MLDVYKQLSYINYSKNFFIRYGMTRPQTADEGGGLRV
jgi:hypothetical protein